MKKLALVLIVALSLVLGGTISFAAVDGDVCTLIKGSKVVQRGPGGGMRGVVVPSETTIEIGPEIPEDMVEHLNGLSDMEWTGANAGVIKHDFGQGPVNLFLIVKESDVKDCK